MHVSLTPFAAFLIFVKAGLHKAHRFANMKNNRESFLLPTGAKLAYGHNGYVLLGYSQNGDDIKPYNKK